MLLIHFLCLFLLIACFIISLYSLFGSPWTSFKSNSQEFTHTLFYSIKTPENYDQANYQCLKELSCNSSEDSTICDISDKLETAKNIFLGFEITSIFIMIMLMERITLKIINRPYGSPRFFLFIIWIFPLVKCAGITSFLIVSNVNVDSNKKSGEINSEYGVYLSIASLVLSIFCAIIMIVSRIYDSIRIIQNLTTVSTAKFLNPFLMLLVTQTLYVLSKIYPTASYKDFSEITINIQYVNEINTYKNLPISCILGQECKISQESCHVFETLDSISDTVFYIEAVGYFFVFLWLESFFHLIFKIRLGTNFLNHLYPVLYTVILLTSLIYYVVKSKIAYGADCNIENFSDKFTLCAKIGTTFYIITVIFAAFTMITYQLLFGIFIVTMGSGNRKIMAEPDDLKKPHNSDMCIQDLDKTGDSTAADVKTNPGTDIIVPSIIIQECDICKQAFKLSENGISEGGKKYHYKCYVLSGN
ncbi:hypothetical protein SteCoe_30269 [Stentor coeruleus]|uniref:Uncharacterized protein n=1 Tax=Stentor coeruleus TaxID=5963 RepID=A0A1R2B443_9CILI|nr:hypothetical protein SteCoe_30269 [Stentor coeruleus]